MKAFLRTIALAMLPALFACGTARSADDPNAGVLPRGLDGHALNLDFERGTLDDWTAAGEAFAGQPIKGDTATARGRGMPSHHTGQFWIGGYERSLSDAPKGTLTSAPFKVTQPYASFRIAGGAGHETRVELVNRASGKVLLERSGDNSETLKPVVIDMRPFAGQEVFIRLVDDTSGGWGHLNFDDFKLYASKPSFPDAVRTTEPDDYPFANLSPEEAAQRMVVPKGFHVTLAAGEPDVKQPIAMALDDRGRLWIAEAYTYPIRAPEGQGKDRVLIFEDADLDGRFESRKVFIEGLNLVSGLEVGFGGIWIGAAPNLLFVPDRDGDDKPDGQPQVLLDGWGYQDTHETLNSFIWGPDGWLYGCHGVFTHSNVGKPGAKNSERTPINAGIWRYHPTRHVFEVFAQGTSNPWGVDFNDLGQAFCTACVIPHLYHIIHNGRYQRQAGEHFNRDTYDDIKTIAVHRHWLGDTPHAGNNRSDAAGGGHAHAGAMIYLGGSWPAEYRDQIFMNNIHGQRINEDLLSPKGSGYVGNRAPDFCLTRDSWSQILNLQYGPDGQVYMIDWYDKNACHHRDTGGHDRTNGRVFKIVYENAKPKHADLKKLSSDELIDLQLNANDWYVRHARRILQERGPAPAVHKKLAEIAFGHQDETRRLRALWALHVTGGLDESRILEGLKNDRPHVRAWTIQLACEDAKRAPSPAVLEAFTKLSRSDDSPVVRLYLAAELQRLPVQQRWAMLPGLLAHSEDAADHNLPLMDWYAAEPLAIEDASRALRLTADGKLPLVFSFMVRRIARLGTPEALATLTAELGKSQAPRQLAMLEAINEGLKGRRQVPMPGGWADISPRLISSADPSVAAQATTLAVTFGDPAALAKLRGVLVDDTAALSARGQALDALLAIKDAQLPGVLQKLLASPELRSAALRGLALFDDAKTPQAILAVYPRLTLQEKRDALNTLSSRANFATVLLSAVYDKKIPAADLSAELVRQLRNHKNDSIDKSIAELWGIARDSSADKVESIAKFTRLVNQKNLPQPDTALGRAVFAKTCQQCHTLFGAGAKIGPELTGSNRANLEYLLSNVLDPSAVMAKEYQPSVIVTSDGRVITGIVKQQDNQALTVQTANESIVVPRGEVDQIQLSQQSMMPDDLLKTLSDHEMRSLVAYVAGKEQVPVLATSDNLKNFFNGRDLSGWHGKSELWSVENGEIVGRTSGLKENEFLSSDYAFGDFRLRAEVRLVDNRGNSGIQFRSQELGDGLVKGYQADIGEGWWGKLYEEHGRGLLWSKSGESHVKNGWNQYEIEAIGSKIRTWINGQPCVDLEDTGGARRGIIALQLHSGGKTEVRYRNFELELNPTPSGR